AAVPLSSQLIRVLGTTARPFKRLHIQGLTMEHCLWAIPANGYAPGSWCGGAGLMLLQLSIELI
ncbi:MAG TPA: hypothetical protein DCR17_11895, partial [Verrucomicrobiales bacterium]|nr:hypothetical protein [Verrucomicrobiales bacterium]